MSRRISTRGGGSGAALRAHPAHPARPRLPSTIPSTILALALAILALAPAASPARADAAGREASPWVERTLAGMTLREKVAQMVMPYIPGGQPRTGSLEWRRARKLVREEKVGGVIVGVGSGTGTAAWLNTLQRLSAVPLLAAADLEWGPGTRLKGGTVLPLNMAMAAAGGPELAREAGRITGEEARAAGLQMTFAPVADVNVNPDNPVINTRSYGADARRVAKCVAAFVEGARSAGLLSVAKHFPGHGDTETDSHLGLPVVGLDRARLDTVELVPFAAAIGAGVAGVMTAHIAVPALEPDGRRRPATLSPPIVTGLLRDSLGFDGLVVTDALIMGGVRKWADGGTVAVQAVEAGADVLLEPMDAKETIDAVVAAVDSGRIEAGRIDASVRRILAAKEAAGLDRRRTVDVAAAARALGSPEHRAFARMAAARSITLVRRGASFPAVLDDGPLRRVVVVAYDDPKKRELGDGLAKALEARGGMVTVRRLWRRSSPAEVAGADSATAGADVVVFATYASTAPWKGTTGLPTDVAALAERLAERGALVVSFGDPYVLGQVPGAGTYILAWTDTQDAVRAAANAMTGETRIVGRLPVPLPPRAERGDGLVLPALAGLVRESRRELAAAAAQRALADTRQDGGAVIPRERPEPRPDGGAGR